MRCAVFAVSVSMISLVFPSILRGSYACGCGSMRSVPPSFCRTGGQVSLTILLRRRTRPWTGQRPTGNDGCNRPNRLEDVPIAAKGQYFPFHVCTAQTITRWGKSEEAIERKRSMIAHCVALIGRLEASCQPASRLSDSGCPDLTDSNENHSLLTREGGCD